MAKRVVEVVREARVEIPGQIHGWRPTGHSPRMGSIIDVGGPNNATRSPATKPGWRTLWSILAIVGCGLLGLILAAVIVLAVRH